MQITTVQSGFWRTGINDSSITKEEEVYDESIQKSSVLEPKGYLGLVYFNLMDFYSPGLSIPMAMKRIVSNVSSPFFADVPRAPTPSINSLSVSGTCHVIDSGRRYATKTNIRSASSSAPNCLQGSVVLGSPSGGAFLLWAGRTQRRARTGWNKNQRPNAIQNGVSFGRLRIL